MNLYKNPIVSRLIWRFILRNPKLRSRIQRAIYGKGERSISLIGQPLTVDLEQEIGYFRAADAQTSNIVFRDEIPQMMTVLSFLERGATFLDLGANVGLWSIQAASVLRVMGGGQVISVEANPGTFARLKRNVAPFTNVALHNVALSDSPGELTFYGGASSGVFSVQKGPFNSGETTTLPAVPLDTLIAPQGELVIKLDVEGHEVPVLRGMSGILGSGRVKAIFVDQFDMASAQELSGLLKGFEWFNGNSRQPVEALDHSMPLLAVRRA